MTESFGQFILPIDANWLAIDCQLQDTNEMTYKKVENLEVALGEKEKRQTALLLLMEISTGSRSFLNWYSWAYTTNIPFNFLINPFIYILQPFHVSLIQATNTQLKLPFWFLKKLILALMWDPLKYSKFLKYFCLKVQNTQALQTQNTNFWFLVFLFYKFLFRDQRFI